MSDDHWLWEGDNGRVEVRRLGSQFVTVDLVGRADDKSTPTIDYALQTVMPIEGVEIYWDAGRLNTFSNSFRQTATEHILKHRKTVGVVAVYSSSALIAMAVSATNLVLGGIVDSYRDADAFFTARRQAALRQGVDVGQLAS